MARHYDMLFHVIKQDMLSEVTNLMDEQEVAPRTREESALCQLQRIQESDGFLSLFDTAHQALHDVYLDDYFGDIFRNIVAMGIEKVIGGGHAEETSSGRPAQAT